MITGIGHIAYRVKDLDATLDFYCNKLGLEKMFSLKNKDGSVWIQYIKVADEQFIEFFPEGEGEWYDNMVYHHLALHTDDIYAEVERIRATGIKIGCEPKEGLEGAIQAWISDPDGNPVELMQLTEKCLQRTC